jgi:hypothetical protein
MLGAMSTQIDDISLLIHFIEGDVVLASNYRLRIQPAQDLFQLFTSRGQLIAWANHRQFPPRIGVRPISEYSELLREILLQHEFMPIGFNNSKQFMEYEYHPIPQDHELSFTLAQDFWKYWWANRKRLVGAKKELEILVFTQQRWEIVEDVAFQAETLFITTSEGETALHSQDYLAWIQPMAAKDEDEKTVCFAADPSAAPDGQTHIALGARETPGAGLKQSDQQPKRSPHPMASAPWRMEQTPLGHVHRCADDTLIVETPHGDIMIVGDRLNFFVVSKNQTTPENRATEQNTREVTCEATSHQRLSQSNCES